MFLFCVWLKGLVVRELVVDYVVCNVVSEVFGVEGVVCKVGCLVEFIVMGECEGVYNCEDECDDYREDMKLVIYFMGVFNFVYGDLGRNLLMSGS